MFRKTFLLLTLTLGWSIYSFSQNIPNYLSKDGLVAWWPFNGNANDESGNGNHGKVNGATLTSDRNGKINSAYQFDNNIEILNSNKIEIGLNTFSFSFWVNRDRITNEWIGEILISKGGNNIVIANCGRNGGLDTNNNFNGFGFDSYGKYYGAYNGILPINKWCHVVCIKSTDKMIYYIDNKKYTTNLNEYDHRSISDLNEFLIFGKSFNGSLDDIACFNRVLSDAEVNSLYTLTPYTCTTPQAPIVTSPLLSICGGTSTKLSATGALAGQTYRWYEVESGGQPLANTATFETTSIPEGETRNYWVSLTNGGCESSRTKMTVTAKALPKVEQIASRSVCNGMLVEETGFNTSPKDAKVYWSVKNTSIGLPANGIGNLLSFIATNTTLVNNTSEVVITPSFDGCIGIAKIFNITVLPSSKVEMGVLPLVIYKTTPVFPLSATPKGGQFYGEGVVGSSFNPLFAALGKQTITYKMVSPEGCASSASRTTIVADTVGTTCISVDTLKIKLKLTTGVHANEITNLNVYPNPTTDLLIIDAADVLVLEGYKYRILDLQGKEVYNSPITKSKTEINLKSLGAKGVYVLHILDTQNNSIEEKKIVLE